MTSPARPAGAPRFVAYSTMTRMPALVGTDAASLLVEARSIPALGYDNRFVEVLEDFIDSTVPADWSDEQWRQLLRGAHGPVPPAQHEELRRVSERSAT